MNRALAVGEYAHPMSEVASPSGSGCAGGARVPGGRNLMLQEGVCFKKCFKVFHANPDHSTPSSPLWFCAPCTATISRFPQIPRPWRCADDIA
jgi:hypothetical protein